jgi:predicted TPR repeat methyltransferase
LASGKPPKRATAVSVIDAAVYWRHAQEALERGNTGLAVTCLENAVRQNPADLEAYRALGRILRFAGRTDEAATWYRRCLEIVPADGVATMGLAALGQGPVPERLPNDVVLYVFDGNAESYEANMLSLGYSVPEILLGLHRAEGGAKDASLDVLDLGCGSGWCGPLFRPFARRLVGVDLSPRMLAIAAAKRVYDELVQSEMLEYLSQAAGGFDVVVAANVLVYFGVLAALVAGVARVLRPGGRFFFDVEKGEGPKPGFHVSGRYTHSLALLESALLPCGFTFSRVHETVMRTELGAPVAGLNCAVRRSS